MEPQPRARSKNPRTIPKNNSDEPVEKPKRPRAQHNEPEVEKPKRPRAQHSEEQPLKATRPRAQHSEEQPLKPTRPRAQRNEPEVEKATRPRAQHNETGTPALKPKVQEQVPKKRKITQEEKDAAAKKYELFGEGLQYKGVGNYQTRQAPSQHASNYNAGTIRMGLDSNPWKVVELTDGTKRWVRAKNAQ